MFRAFGTLRTTDAANEGSFPSNPQMPIARLAVGALSFKKARNASLLHVDCDAKMYHMKKASVRDLRYRFSVVEDLLRDGHEIQITKRKRVIARLLPPETVVPVEMPDFLGRMKKIFGKKRMKVSGAELIALDREERF